MAQPRVQALRHNPFPQLRILMSTNLARYINPPVLVPALSRPSFSPTGGRFVCGTEDQTQFTQNHLVFAQLADTGTKLREFADGQLVYTIPVPDHVRDTRWVDDRHVLFAAGSKIGLITITEEGAINAPVMFPDFHKDTLREIAINEVNPNLVASGGFDGKVFVTDISRLVGDINKNLTRSSNIVYDCRDVVGSVAWCPEDPYLVSCTTDVGMLHIFDVRTGSSLNDNERHSIVQETGKLELFTHSYRDSNTVFLGYGDGSISVFDLRNCKTVASFNDPYQKIIGDICFDPTRRIFCVFGHPGFSAWQISETGMQLFCSTDSSVPGPSVDKYYVHKTTGEFRRDSQILAVTDSNGTLNIYDAS